MTASFITVLKQGLFFPKNFLGGHLQKPSASQDSLHPGEGAVIEVDGQKVAAYKNEAGEVEMHSAVCTHMGCIVGWNNTEKTWDCPCHGSRYSKDGKVIQGPAKRDLSSK